nr:MAG TPA: hypothetical protein [Caudoviricetes sp.]
MNYRGKILLACFFCCLFFWGVSIWLGVKLWGLVYGL